MDGIHEQTCSYIIVPRLRTRVGILRDVDGGVEASEYWGEMRHAIAARKTKTVAGKRLAPPRPFSHVRMVTNRYAHWTRD
jgi:hypothetical protein